MTVKLQTQPDYIKAISEIAEAMPLARIVQLYEFALFLKTNPLPTEETFEQIIADEALWDMQFAATPDERLTELVASVEAKLTREKHYRCSMIRASLSNINEIADIKRLLETLSRTAA